MRILEEKNGIILIALSAIAVSALLLMKGPIPQAIEYHNFSDTRTFLSIPNTLNVLSNLPLLFVGLAGVYSLVGLTKDKLKIHNNRAAYYALFGGAVLVSIGSGYYHLWPDNQTLVWDRLPMTITFMAFYSIVISEFASEKLGSKLLIPLLFAGILSVLYWWLSEEMGSGDLRFYAVVQFFPIITAPIFLVFFKSGYNLTGYYWLLLFAFVSAKLFEHFDSQVYASLSFISGHSLKHIMSAVGLYFLLLSYKKRGYS
ncbi:ceramidase domain-containing protein [Amphritea sp. HPY]|uniref:ceramidase domain-containing protein n=1 Tax=Amphritea sp. HPY TaxID=3421652 RepID=UPI003D7F08E6